LIDLVNPYAYNPIKTSELLGTVGEEAEILEKIKAGYIDSIVQRKRRLLSIPERNGWLIFLTNNANVETDPCVNK